MDYVHDFIHKNFGMHKYRPSIKVRADAFYQYLPQDKSKDQQVIARLGNTITDLSDACFNACVDPNHKYYTFSEKHCIRKCVQNYFQDFEDIVLQTTKRIHKQREKRAKQEKESNI